MTRAVWLVLAIIALPLSGCADECLQLAEKTCARVGQNDPLCGKLRQVAASPRGDDKKACAAGLEFVEELEKR